MYRGGIVVTTKAEWLAKRPMFTCLLSGYFGAGKSIQALSFPKCYVISIDPAGLEPLRQARNAKLLENLVEVEELGRQDANDLKLLFKEDPKEMKSIYGCIEKAREMATKGEVETLVIDGGTYLVDLVWAKITELEQVKSEKTGNVDGQAMYRSLGLYLYRLFASNLLTTASRANLNLIITFHLKRESELQMQGTPKTARKLMLNSDIALQIEGGFRNKVEGLFGGSLYLEKTLKDGVIRYEAICDVAKAFQTTVLAKNRWGLAPRIDLTAKTLYEHLMETIGAKKSTAAK
jgi:hypothetical protein